MIVIGYKFLVQARVVCVKIGVTGEKKARKTLIYSALLRGTEPLKCGCLISPRADACVFSQTALEF
jgi:hypothetical protein